LSKRAVEVADVFELPIQFLGGHSVIGRPLDNQAILRS
jgi:hypothetical protein